MNWDGLGHETPDDSDDVTTVTPGQLALASVCQSHPKVTPETIEAIIQYRLNGHSDRWVAAQVGHNKDTVNRIYNDFRREGGAALLDDPAPYLFEAVERAEQGMAGAWHLWTSTGDVKYLTAYQRAEDHLAKLRGLTSTVKHEVTGADGAPVAVDFVWREEVITEPAGDTE